MASSGTINNTFRTGYAIRIVWSVGSQSVANNTSSVTASVQLVSLGSSYNIVSSASKSGTLTINGTAYSFTFNASLNGNQVKTLFTKAVTVAHNANGTKTCSFSCAAGINVTLSGTYYGTVTASGSGVFDTIGRASTISSVTASVSVTGSNAVTVAIARASSSFTHTVTISFGSYSNTQTGIGTSASYTIPMTWLNAIPSATSGTATVTVTTYSGSTKIGSSASRNFTLTVPSSVVPSIASVSLSEAVSGISGQFQGYVQNKSKLACSVASAGAYSSTITATRTTILGVTYNQASFTSGFLTSSGSVTVQVTVTDSRNRTASTTRTITVLAYSPPTITSFTGFRSLSNGVEDYEGSSVNCFYDFNIASVNNRNTGRYVFHYKLTSATAWTSLASGSAYAINSNRIFSNIASADSSFDIRLEISDFFTTISKTFEIPTGFTLIDYNRTGRAVAFGKVSELAEGVEFGLDVYFRKKIIGLFPVGSIFMSVVNVNPSTYFGGTWSAWGSGRVPVGVNTSDSNFNSVEKTGGASTHTLTVSQMPSHQHNMVNSNATGYAYEWTKAALQANGAVGYAGNAFTSFIGGNASHNNLQPFITCYMWKRTA